MSQTIQIRRGLQANVAGASLATGEIIFTTDTGMVYVYDGSAKQLIGRVLQGTLAARPAYGVAGRLYYANGAGETETYLDTGSAWVTVGVSDLADMSGDLDDIADGSSYQKVAATEVDANGYVTQLNDNTNVVTASQARSHIDSTSNPHTVTASQVGIDDLGDIADGGGYQKVADTEVDANGYVTQLNDDTNVVTASQARSHIDSTSNPHSTSIANIGSGTIANLNTAISDGTIGAGLNDAGTSSADLWSATKIQNVVDNAISGLSWKEPVDSVNLIGNATIATINGLSPATGDCYVATSAGTPTAGTSDALVIGSVTEFDGTSWKELVAGSGGYVADGVRAALSTATALIAPYTDATDDGKIVAFDGTSLTGADTGDAVSEAAVLVQNSGGVTDNVGYVFEGSVPTGTWTQFTGAGQITAGTGLSKSGNILNVNLGAGIQQLPSDEVGIDLATTSGLELTSALTNGQLRLSAQGNGIAGGAGSLLSVNPDSTTGGNMQAVNVAPNGVGLNVNAIAGTGIEADGSANLRLAAQGNGIAGGAGSTLSVNPDSTTGATVAPVSVVANGVGVTVDNSSIVHTTGTIAVGTIDGGTF